MRFGVGAALVIGLLAPVLGAQQAVLAKRSVSIKEARAVYTAVEKATRQRQLTARDTTVTCQYGLLARATIYRDSHRRIRRITTDGGTGDHGETVTTYFDSLGHPRFAYAQRGAVNGTQQEERVYVDARGAVVHRLIRQTRGPGYPFGKLTKIPRVDTWIRDLCG